MSPVAVQVDQFQDRRQSDASNFRVGGMVHEDPLADPEATMP